jgi:hypothetical protein
METETQPCSLCGICAARKTLSNTVLAVLVDKGSIEPFTSRDKAENALIEARKINPESFLIRGYIPEELKSYNLVDGNDIPF